MEGPRLFHVLLEGTELNPNLLDRAESEPSQGRRHGDTHPGPERLLEGSGIGDLQAEWKFSRTFPGKDGRKKDSFRQRDNSIQNL